MPLTFKDSDVIAVSSSSAQFGTYSAAGTTTMVSGAQYVLSATTDIWWRADAASPTAAANTDDNHFLARGATALIAGSGFKVAVIRDTADGYACLAMLEAG